MATAQAISVFGPEYQDHGVYHHYIEWRVANGDGGYLIQHIKRDQVVELNGRVRRSRDSYWEAWRVHNETALPRHLIKNPGADVVCVNDRFIHKPAVISPSKSQTRGHWRIQGVVYWVPGDVFHEEQWIRDPDAPQGGAGILRKRRRRPTAARGAPIRLRQVMDTRLENGEWDSVSDERIPHGPRVRGGRVHIRGVLPLRQG